MDSVAKAQYHGTFRSGTVVEAHPKDPYWWRDKTVTFRSQITPPNIKRWQDSWNQDSKWDFIEERTRPACVKLNLGCGEMLNEGWIGLDPRTHLHKNIIDWDFSRPIPFHDWTADAIMTSHVFNYIPEEDYATALLEIWRVLRPEGVLRMAEDRTDNGYTWRNIGQPARHTGEIKSLPTQDKILNALKQVGYEIHDANLDTTLSPHKDILQYNSRYRRYRLGHKFYVEAVKKLDSARYRMKSDPRRKRNGKYIMPEISK